MEVPYLDVLQTTTNTKLPLTFLETDEFGLPMQRLSDFTGMMRWSPMELLRADSTKAKEVQQIVRTGLHDKEVYAYESVKWVERCGRQCLLAVEDGQGHFVHGRTGLEQQGMDLAVLLDLASA
jgi:protease II